MIEPSDQTSLFIADVYVKCCNILFKKALPQVFGFRHVWKYKTVYIVKLGQLVPKSLVIPRNMACRMLFYIHWLCSPWWQPEEIRTELQLQPQSEHVKTGFVVSRAPKELAPTKDVRRNSPGPERTLLSSGSSSCFDFYMKHKIEQNIMLKLTVHHAAFGHLDFYTSSLCFSCQVWLAVLNKLSRRWTTLLIWSKTSFKVSAVWAKSRRSYVKSTFDKGNMFSEHLEPQTPSKQFTFKQ